MHLLGVLPPFKQEPEAPLISSTIIAKLPIMERGRGDHLKAQPNKTLMLPILEDKSNRARGQGEMLVSIKTLMLDQLATAMTVDQEDAIFQPASNLLEVHPLFVEIPLISSTSTAKLPIMERGRGDHLKAQPNETLILIFSQTLMLELSVTVMIVVQEDVIFQAVMYLLEVLPPLQQEAEAPLIRITSTAKLPILERGRKDHLQPLLKEVLILPFTKTFMLEQ